MRALLAAALAWVLLGASIAGAEPVHVEINLKSGELVSGELEAAPLHVESSLGGMDVNWSDLTGIALNGPSAQLSLSDGTTIQGSLAVREFHVRVGEGELVVMLSDASYISVSRARPRPGAAVAGAGAGTGAGKSGDASKPPPLEPPAATLELNDAVGWLGLSPDGEQLYALCAPTHTLVVVETATFQVKSRIELPPGTLTLSPLPGGGRYLIAARNRVSLLDVAAGRVTEGLELNVDVFDAFAVDEETVFLTTDKPGITVLSMTTKAAARQLPGGRGRLQPRPDRRKVYADDGDLLLPSTAPFQGQEHWLWEANPRPTTGWGVLSFFPDGRFAVTTRGQVYRLGRSYQADLIPCGKVPGFTCMAFLPRAQRMLLLSDYRLVECDMTDFRTTRDFSTKLYVAAAVADEERKVVYVAGAETSSMPVTLPTDPFRRSFRSAPTLFKLRVP
ncbi:MAG: hypothetical protein HYZ53_10480 [Planctomycetes bacterium]|nr:hypothetical protein [Planctomycetota bacterium]